jgi:hypothetical protein
MTIDYSTPGKVHIHMTPAASHLFIVNEQAQQLSEASAELFHRNTEKLLFLCKRARPDVQTPVAFLCTRVKSPDVDDYIKLRRTMQYLRGSAKLCLTLEA